MSNELRNRFQTSDIVHNPESDTVTIPRNEYNRLKSLEGKLQKAQTIIIWILFLGFMTLIYLSISYNINQNEKLGIKLDSYYKNELNRVKMEVENPMTEEENLGKLRNNKRPGRIYHRGGNYGGSS